MKATEQIRKLLDQGLTAYGLGQVNEALEAWRSVLALDPGNAKAREYIRFVEENWGPRQERTGEPYRPDESSGETFQIEADPQPAPAGSPAEDGVEKEVGFERSAFTPPAKPIMQADSWGDLYNYSEPEPAAAGANPQPDPLPPPAVMPQAEPEPAASPEAGWEKIAPLAGDWSGALTSWEKEPGGQSTLPPHPSPGQDQAEPMPIIEPDEEYLPDEPLAAEEPADGDPQATKRYDSVPTSVRPPEARPPDFGAFAGSASESDEFPRPPQGGGMERDSLDRFPVDPAPPAPSAQPAEGRAFYQVPGSDLLDLVSGEEPAYPDVGAVPGISSVSETESLMKGARDMLALDDFSGALELLDKVLEQSPENALAQTMRVEAERELLSMLSSKLGNLNRTPRQRMSQDEIIWLNLDHRAGFVLSLVDGSLSLDEIISICNLPQLEAMRILVQLLQEKVIEIT